MGSRVSQAAGVCARLRMDANAGGVAHALSMRARTYAERVARPVGHAAPVGVRRRFDARAWRAAAPACGCREHVCHYGVHH
eukprot:4861628-Pleurochrysis_carterae.AAC.2